MIITPLLVILILIVFVLLFLFLNTIDKRKWLTFLIALVLTPFAYFYMLYPFINIFSSYHHQKYFNSETWVEDPSLRYEMISHTVESDTLVGMSKAQAKELLGNYEWLSWNDALKNHDTDKWNYGLGLKPGAFNENKECVEIRFKDDKVEALRVFQQKMTYEKGK